MNQAGEKRSIQGKKSSIKPTLTANSKEAVKSEIFLH